MLPSSELSTNLCEFVHTRSDSNIIIETSNFARADMTDCNYKNELEKAQANAMKALMALENLTKGIQAVKRILEQRIDSDDYDNLGCACESSDAKLVSILSDKLLGIPGSELLGLLNAAQMAKGHARLRVEDESSAIQDLHHANELSRTLNDRADKAERRNLRLTAEKKLLVKEVRYLLGDRRLLIKEVKSLHKMTQSTKQFDDWRLLDEHVRGAVTVHESVLNNKTFQSGFAGIDPPGVQVTKDIDIEDKHSNIPVDHTSPLSVSEKENNVQHSYFPRKETHGHQAGNKVLKYIKGNHKQVKSVFKVKPTPESMSNPIVSKKRGLPFRTGISNSFTTGFGRFKNVLQEASDQMKYHEDDNAEQACRKENCDRKVALANGQYHSQANKEKHFCKVKRNENKENYTNNDFITLDDEATGSTESCSFDMETLNLSSSMSSCSDDGITNDLALQISIDDGSSLLDIGPTDGIVNSPSSPQSLMITPDSSPLARQYTKVFLKPRCSPNVLRTLTMPNGNAVEQTISSSPVLKPQFRSFSTRR